MPSGLVEDEDGVGAGRDHGGDLGEMQSHRFGGAPWQHEARPFALGGTDGTEDVGRGGPLIVRGGRPGAALRPAPRDLVLLADPRLVLKPDLYRLAADLLFDSCHDGREIFLKSSAAASSFA